MGFLGKIFGTAKSVEQVVGSVTRGLDALVYTDEEKAGDAADERRAARREVIEYMKATSAQNVTRRVIALTIIAMWALTYFTSMVMVQVSVFTGDVLLATKLQEASTLLDDNISDIEQSLMIVLVFYFGAPHMEKVIGGWLQSRQRTTKS